MEVTDSFIEWYRTDIVFNRPTSRFFLEKKTPHGLNMTLSNPKDGFVLISKAETENNKNVYQDYLDTTINKKMNNSRWSFQHILHQIINFQKIQNKF